MAVNVRLLQARKELVEKYRAVQQGFADKRKNAEKENQDIASKTNKSEAARAARKASMDSKSAKAEMDLADKKAKSAAVGMVLGAVSAMVGAVGAAAKAIGSAVDNKKTRDLEKKAASNDPKVSADAKQKLQDKETKKLKIQGKSGDEAAKKESGDKLDGRIKEAGGKSEKQEKKDATKNTLNAISSIISEAMKLMDKFSGRQSEITASVDQNKVDKAAGAISDATSSIKEGIKTAKDSIKNEKEMKSELKKAGIDIKDVSTNGRIDMDKLNERLGEKKDDGSTISDGDKTAIRVKAAEYNRTKNSMDRNDANMNGTGIKLNEKQQNIMNKIKKGETLSPEDEKEIKRMAKDMGIDIKGSDIKGISAKVVDKVNKSKELEEAIMAGQKGTADEKQIKLLKEQGALVDKDGKIDKSSLNKLERDFHGASGMAVRDQYNKTEEGKLLDKLEKHDPAKEEELKKKGELLDKAKNKPETLTEEEKKELKSLGVMDEKGNIDEGKLENKITENKTEIKNNTISDSEMQKAKNMGLIGDDGKIDISKVKEAKEDGIYALRHINQETLNKFDKNGNAKDPSKVTDEDRKIMKGLGLELDKDGNVKNKDEFKGKISDLKDLAILNDFKVEQSVAKRREENSSNFFGSIGLFGGVRDKLNNTFGSKEATALGFNKDAVNDFLKNSNLSEDEKKNFLNSMYESGGNADIALNKKMSEHLFSKELAANKEDLKKLDPVMTDGKFDQAKYSSLSGDEKKKIDEVLNKYSDTSSKGSVETILDKNGVLGKDGKFDQSKYDEIKKTAEESTDPEKKKEAKAKLEKINEALGVDENNPLKSSEDINNIIINDNKISAIKSSISENTKNVSGSFSSSFMDALDPAALDDMLRGSAYTINSLTEKKDGIDKDIKRKEKDINKEIKGLIKDINKNRKEMGLPELSEEEIKRAIKSGDPNELIKYTSKNVDLTMLNNISSKFKNTNKKILDLEEDKNDLSIKIKGANNNYNSAIRELGETQNFSSLGADKAEQELVTFAANEIMKSLEDKNLTTEEFENLKSQFGSEYIAKAFNQLDVTQIGAFVKDSPDAMKNFANFINVNETDKDLKNNSLGKIKAGFMIAGVDLVDDKGDPINDVEVNKAALKALSISAASGNDDSKTALSNIMGQMKPEEIKTVFGDLEKDNPAAAAAILGKLPQDKVEEFLKGNKNTTKILSALISQDPKKAAELFNSGQISNDIISKLAKEDPRAMAEILNNMSPEEGKKILGNLGLNETEQARIVGTMDREKALELVKGGNFSEKTKNAALGASFSATDDTGKVKNIISTDNQELTIQELKNRGIKFNLDKEGRIIIDKNSEKDFDKLLKKMSPDQAASLLLSLYGDNPEKLKGFINDDNYSLKLKAKILTNIANGNSGMSDTNKTKFYESLNEENISKAMEKMTDSAAADLLFGLSPEQASKVIKAFNSDFDSDGNRYEDSENVERMGNILNTLNSKDKNAFNGIIDNLSKDENRGYLTEMVIANREFGKYAFRSLGERDKHDDIKNLLGSIDNSSMWNNSDIRADMFAQLSSSDQIAMLKTLDTKEAAKLLSKISYKDAGLALGELDSGAAKKILDEMGKGDRAEYFAAINDPKIQAKIMEEYFKPIEVEDKDGNKKTSYSGKVSDDMFKNMSNKEVRDMIEVMALSDPGKAAKLISNLNAQGFLFFSGSKDPRYSIFNSLSLDTQENLLKNMGEDKQGEFLTHSTNVNELSMRLGKKNVLNDYINNIKGGFFASTDNEKLKFLSRLNPTERKAFLSSMTDDKFAEIFNKADTESQLKFLASLSPDEVKNSSFAKLSVNSDDKNYKVDKDDKGNIYFSDDEMNSALSEEKENAINLNKIRMSKTDAMIDDENNKALAEGKQIGGAVEETTSQLRKRNFNWAIIGLDMSMAGIKFFLEQLDKLREAQDQKKEAETKYNAALKLERTIMAELKRQGVQDGDAGAGGAGSIE